MDKELAEKQAKFLAGEIEKDLAEFLRKNPLEKLEVLQEKLKFNKILHPLITDLLNDLKLYDSRSDSPDKWQDMEGRILSETSWFHQTFYQSFLYFNVIQTFFSSRYSPIQEEYRKQQKSKYNLTPKKMQQALFETLNELHIEKVKHGGSKGFWNDNNRRELLALYNRFLIVIKNSRTDVKMMVKKGKSELLAENEILAKYEIPDTLIKSAFSAYDAPKDVALTWAKQEMKLKFSEEYLKDVLTEARKFWRSRSKGLISQQTLNEHPKIHLILIDINFEFGCREYAVSSINKNDMKKLKYGTVAKKFNGEIKFVAGEKWDDFLVSGSF